jgi:exo-beta-1,3-glucanase (GH17 family)
MITARPSNSERAAVAYFEALIATYGEAQARLQNLQKTAKKEGFKHDSNSTSSR